MEILCKLFEEVLCLKDWLKNLTDLNTQNEEFELCMKSMESIYVGCPLDKKVFNPASLSQQSYQHEIILRTIQRILKKRGQNVIAFGFSMASEEQNAPTWQAIESKFPNSSVKCLQTQPWKNLLSCVGDEVMLHILENLSLFLQIGPTSFVQLTGLPVYELPVFDKGQVLDIGSKKWGKKIEEESKLPVVKKKEVCQAPVAPKESEERQLPPIEGNSGECNMPGSKRKLNDCQLQLPEAKRRKLEKCQRLSAKTKSEECQKLIAKSKECLRPTTSKNSGEFQRSTAKRKSEDCQKPTAKRRRIDQDHKEGVNDSHPGSMQRQQSTRKNNNNIMFKAFDPMVVLPRRKLLYTVNIREKIPKSAPMLMCENSPAGVLALYQSIFVDVNEVSNDKVTVNPHSLRDVQGILSDCRQEKLCAGQNASHNKENCKPVTGQVAINMTQAEPSTSNTKSDNLVNGQVNMCVSRSTEDSDGQVNLCVSKSTKDSDGQVNMCVSRSTKDSEVNRTPKVNQNEISRNKKSDYSLTEHEVPNEEVDVETHVIRESCPLVPGQRNVSLDDISKDSGPETSRSKERDVLFNTHGNISVKLAANDSVNVGTDLRVIPYLLQVQRNIRKCPFKFLLNRHCPVQTKMNVRKCKRQRVTIKTSRKGFYRKQSHTVPITKLLNDHTHHKQVYLYLRVCLLRILPEGLIGGIKNRNLILKKMLMLLSMGKYDKLSLGQLMTGLKTTEVDWLQGISSNSCRLYLLSRLVYWLFVHVIFCVLRTMFYITDTTFLRYKILYYRQIVWNRIAIYGLHDLLRRKTIKPMSKTKVQDLVQTKASLGVSLLRFLPKQKSLRPIINMSTCVTAPELASQKRSINKEIVDLKLLLTHLEKQNPALIGFGILGNDQIYASWKRFKAKCQEMGMSKFYFIKTDISKCFESIQQAKLMEVMEKMFQEEVGEEDLIITRYVIVSQRGRTARRIFLKKVFSLYDFEPDVERHTVKLLKEEKSNIILVDKMCHSYETGQDFLNVLRSHTSLNIIKFGSQYYLHTEGISQGSMLSTLLCNFYYADMERKYLKVKDTEFLMRIVDDYLFVTPDLQNAVTFLQQMLKGIPEYNCYTNTDKTLINFHHGDFENIPTVDNDWFPWCGMLFNTRTLEVAMDYERYFGRSITDTMSYDLTRSPGKAMKNKLSYSVRQKCQGIFIDHAVNSDDQIVKNVFHLFCFSTLQFRSFVKKLPVKHNGGVPFTLLEDIINCLSRCIQEKLRTAQGTSGHHILKLKRNKLVKWICLYAFITMFRRHKAQYKLPLKSLMEKRARLEKNIPKETISQLLTICGTEFPKTFKLMLN